MLIFCLIAAQTFGGADEAGKAERVRGEKRSSRRAITNYMQTWPITIACWANYRAHAFSMTETRRNETGVKVKKESILTSLTGVDNLPSSRVLTREKGCPLQIICKQAKVLRVS